MPMRISDALNMEDSECMPSSQICNSSRVQEAHSATLCGEPTTDTLTASSLLLDKLDMFESRLLIGMEKLLKDAFARQSKDWTSRFEAKHDSEFGDQDTLQTPLKAHLNTSANDSELLTAAASATTDATPDVGNIVEGSGPQRLSASQTVRLSRAIYREIERTGTTDSSPAVGNIVEGSGPQPLPASQTLELSQAIYREMVHDRFSRNDICLQRLVTHASFKSLITIFIVAQSLFHGWQAHVNLQVEFKYLDGEAALHEHLWYIDAISAVLHGVFILELGLRIAAWRMVFFNRQYNEFFKWNLFDLSLCLGWLAAQLAFPRHASIFVTLRTWRLLKVARFFRHSQIFTDYLNMIRALLHSFRTLFWLLILIWIILFMFAVAFAECTVMYLHDIGPDRYRRAKAQDFSGEEELFQVIDRFSTIWKTMMSLFVCIAGGDDWYQVLSPIIHGSWYPWALSMGFIVFFSFSVMNVVTGVFVDRALSIKEGTARTTAWREARRKEKEIEDEVKQFTKVLDWDGDGRINRFELRKVMEEHLIQGWLAYRDIDLSDSNLDCTLEMLFGGDQHDISRKQVEQVLMSMKGNARSSDITRLSFDIRQTRAALQTILKLISNQSRQREDLKHSSLDIGNSNLDPVSVMPGSGMPKFTL